MYSSTNPRFDQSITLKPILSSIPQQTPELTIPQSQRQTEPSQTPPTEERNPEITIESQSVEKEEEEAKIDDFISGSETKVPQNHEKDGFLPFLLNDQKSQRVEIFMMDNSLVIQPKMSQQPAETTMAAKCELISNVSEEANGGRDISGETGSNGYCRKRYRRSDMEALKFVNVEEQRKMWNEIYIGLEPAVSREFDNLSAEKSSIGKPQKPKSRRRSAMGLKKDKNLILSEVCNQDMHINFGEPDIVEACPQKMKDGLQVVVHDCNDELAIDVECHQNDDSDGEINSIQRPAFFVDGDPDFESGPPQDGLEYLRRVRWETLQMPKVKVVKLDSNKLLKEQTDYMPKVADIANCPQHLLPSKQWEDNFLSDFSELRAALSRFESSNVQNSSSLSMDKEESSQCSNEPTVSLVLGMDSVSRTSMLKNRIRSLQYATTLSKDECSWVFALCVAVDTPFDADTSSYLRCLLRKCASLRSEKLEVDDEVVMLNILATISGRYFGQLEV